MKNIVKQILESATKEWVKYQKRKMYREMIVGIKLKKLSKEEKEDINSYYEKLLGKRINPRWHQYYSSINGVFTPKYIPLGLYYAQIVPMLNDRTVSKAYADKNFTERLFPEMLQPKTIVKNINGFYYLRGKPIAKEEALSICNNLSDAVIKQAMETSQGKSVIRFSSSDGMTTCKGLSVQKLFDLYKKNYIVQEVVRQHAILSKLNPTSLNTVRLTTFRREEDVVVLTSLLRMGRKDALVDNVSVGGVFCEISPDGRLKAPAYSIKPTGRYDYNDFGVKYEGIQVPQYEEIVRKAKEMHLQLPYTRIVGWDFTVDEDSQVVLIELNLHSPGVYQLIGPALGEYTDEILTMVKKG
ncbi:sugar-transfer associated ATP-grasp domain-containing protein [Odoribacter sp. AF15-53]|uniref:sugar-transfer associated ATP-grasp domain-containing protein n=1 Tax=Odoribacter sp. AF15-53 TaxID=2292236 RepID=UPI000E50D5AC|nr:sugar-transfer associated ATP-grasp domain-containing protein [Odoribacter sp. AF15-53]RHR80926.1 hypothetical protein DWW52_08045 [Odoribacter sp. AF15-53]